MFAGICSGFVGFCNWLLGLLRFFGSYLLGLLRSVGNYLKQIGKSVHIHVNGDNNQIQIGDGSGIQVSGNARVVSHEAPQETLIIPVLDTERQNQESLVRLAEQPKTYVQRRLFG